MAGHSKFANIKHRKNAQDAKRAKIFTRLIKEVTVAAKTGGPDPDANARLRGAIITARAANVPKDRIENAVKKGAGGNDGVNYDSMRYEGYGNAGSAFIVEVLTDNKNRSAAEIRTIFSKNAGALAETGSVSFMFDHLGIIRYSEEKAEEDSLFEDAVEFGADSLENEDGVYVISCSMEAFIDLRDKLIEKYGDPDSAALEWVAQNHVAIADDKAVSILKLIDALEDNDDVQNYFTNADISSEAVAEFENNK